MREIVLDTETTGLDPGAGHRIVEIGCIELFNHVPTGKTFHRYLNPERDSDWSAFAVHQLPQEFLLQQARFAEIADEFLVFVGDGQLVIHNAEFDIKFINYELDRAGRPPLPLTRVTDTIVIAREKYPGAQASLDALCRRFEIDVATRDERHGALIDAGLLAKVYLELVGGRQPGLDFVAVFPGSGALVMPKPAAAANVLAPRRDIPGASATAGELARHAKFLDRLKDALWRRLS